MDCGKVPSGVRKVKKKKKVKDELDRIKQAEKKKRRLEKALATSAAIRSELEKKKQKKKEEQQRLDEEGAAIAEAVALHVLLDGDSDDSCEVTLKTDDGLNQCECGSSFDLLMGARQEVVPHQTISRFSLEGIELVSNSYRHGCIWDDCGRSVWMVSPDPSGRAFCPQYFQDGGLDTAEISASLLAAQAVSSLQIDEDTPIDAYDFNQIFRG